jgi:hypothetical protein
VSLAARIETLEALLALGPSPHAEGMLAAFRMVAAEPTPVALAIPEPSPEQAAELRAAFDRMRTSVAAAELQVAITTEEKPAPAAFLREPDRITQAAQRADAAKPRKPHWTQTESPEARAARMAKINAARRGGRATGHIPAGMPWPAEAAEARQTLEAEVARAEAIGKPLTPFQQAKVLLAQSLEEHLVAMRTGLPLREVYRARAENREEGRR